MRRPTIREQGYAIDALMRVCNKYYGYYLNKEIYIGHSSRFYPWPWPGRKKIYIDNLEYYIKLKAKLIVLKSERTKNNTHWQNPPSQTELILHQNLNNRFLKEIYDQNEEYFINVFYKTKPK